MMCRKYLFILLSLCLPSMVAAALQQETPVPPLDTDDVTFKENTLLSTALKDSKKPTPDPFAALLTRRGPSAIRLKTREPQVYETTQGDETFVFQANGNTALIRFLCDSSNSQNIECALLGGQRGEEVYLLTATRSPRGDVIYKDIDGASVLRVTSNGGATLFLPGLQQENPYGPLTPAGGTAVLPIVGMTGSLTAPSIDFELVEERMRRATDLLVEKYSTIIFFEAPGPDSTNQAVLADAILTTTKGIDLVASDPLGEEVLTSKVETVRFVPSDAPSVDLTEGLLTITYNAKMDVAGRPSSAAVARYLESVL